MQTLLHQAFSLSLSLSLPAHEENHLRRKNKIVFRTDTVPSHHSHSPVSPELQPLSWGWCSYEEKTMPKHILHYFGEPPGILPLFFFKKKRCAFHQKLPFHIYCITHTTVLHISAPGHLQRLPVDITHVRAAQGQDTAGRLGGCPGPPERDVHVHLRPFAALGLDLAPRNPQGDFGAVRGGDGGAVLLGAGQSGVDVPERDGVGAHAELRAPFFCYCFGEPGHARFGEGVVDLPCVAVRAGRAGDLDDAAGLAVLDAEVGRGGAHEAEGGGVVHGQDGVPLFVGHLVDHAVPGEAGVVDDVVDLAVAELRGLLDQVVDVGCVHDVARHC